MGPVLTSLGNTFLSLPRDEVTRHSIIMIDECHQVSQLSDHGGIGFASTDAKSHSIVPITHNPYSGRSVTQEPDMKEKKAFDEDISYKVNMFVLQRKSMARKKILLGQTLRKLSGS